MARNRKPDTQPTAEDVIGALIVPDPPRTRNLERALTEEEIDELRADRLVDDAEIERLQVEIGRMSEDLKDKKKRVEVLIKEGLESSRTLTRKTKWADLECYYRDNKIGPDWIRFWYRSDTMAEIDREPVPFGERQADLFSGPATTDPVDDQF